MQLSKGINLVYVGALVANANNTDDNSTILDMQGYDGVIFFTTITDCAATGVATLTVEQDAANADGSMAALSGGAAAKTCSTNDDLNGTGLVVDVYKPQKRYLQAVRTSATANIAFGECWAIQYDAKNKPVTQGDTISTIVTPVSPAEA